MRWFACKDSLEAWDDGISRFNFDAQVSQQDLADTYLVAFKAAVQRAKASGIMWLVHVSPPPVV